MFTSGISSMFTFGLRNLYQVQQERDEATERLATGKRVNSAKDDPSAITPIAEHEAEIYSLNKELDTISRNQAMYGAKEGALSVLSDLLIEFESIVVRTANTGGNSPEELEAFQAEASSILSGINHLANSTTFRGQQILTGFSSASFGEDFNNITELLESDPEKAQEVAMSATKRVSTARAAIGSAIREGDSKRAVIEEELINLNASLSTIQDTDYAKETAKLVRAQILESATIKAIEISRENAKQVLGLIQNTIPPNKLAA
jgi:flagellin